MAAMRVVMSMQSAEDCQDDEAKQNDYMTTSQSLDGDMMSDNNRDLEERLNGLHDYSSSLERPEPMEHMLTEDGEPMLNPGESFCKIFPILVMLRIWITRTAELLTQVSWYFQLG